MKVRRRMVRTGGIDLETAWYEAVGADAPTLVFLHEGLGSLALWRDFPARMARATGCHALVYSRQGYGGSSRLPGGFATDYMHREALQVLPRLLDHFSITGPVLYGHSDGASIALLHAGLSGRPVSAVIVEAPHVFVEPESVAGVDAAVAAWQTGDLRRRLSRYHHDCDSAFHAWSTIWRSQEFLDWNIEHCLDRIRVPVLAIQGEDDPYGTLAQIEAITARVAGASDTLVLPGCGHGPHRENTDRVLARVEAFLGSSASCHLSGSDPCDTVRDPVLPTRS